MGWLIALGVGVLFIGYVYYNYHKIKNIKDVPPSNKIKQLSDKSFKREIGNGLVLVDFWAPWCAPCKIIAPTLNEIAEEFTQQITIAKVNIDQNKTVAQKYNIRNIPTLILFKNGREDKRIIGIKTKNALIKELSLK